MYHDPPADPPTQAGLCLEENNMVSMAVGFLFGVLIGFGVGYLMGKNDRRPNGWRGEDM